MGSNMLTGDTELQSQIDRARKAGDVLDELEIFAIDAWYEASKMRVFIEMSNGVQMGFPVQLLQGLQGATGDQLSEVELTSTGYGLHWEKLDVDLGVPQLIAGLFGTKQWMQELGRKGGSVKSTAKAKSSRENGKLGGRPKKSKTPVLDERKMESFRKNMK